jgi:hypothetical protein
MVGSWDVVEGLVARLLHQGLQHIAAQPSGVMAQVIGHFAEKR